MQTRSIPSVTLYIRITDEKGTRRYERVNRRKPQLSGGTYCLHFYTPDGKRKWTTVGTDINAALKARMEKESELLTRPVGAKPSPTATEALRGASHGIYPRQENNLQEGGCSRIFEQRTTVQIIDRRVG